MKKLRLALEAAGISRFSPAQFLLGIIVLSTFLATWIQLSFGILGLTIFSALATVGLGLESLRLRGKRRVDQMTRLWPEVLDGLESAATSSYGVIDSLEQLARVGPPRVQPIFQELVDRIDSGFGVDQSLDWFKSQFGSLQADRLVELIRIVHRSGGGGYIDSLREQSASTRSEIALWGELESKQGWVTGTAKLAIIAPWIIIATLAARDENVAIYNTTEGTGILSVGLIVSLIAYRLVNLMGLLSKPGRVLTN